MSPIPGPTLEIADAAAENAVRKSKLKKLKDIAEKINNKIYIKKKPITELYVFSFTVFPLNLITKIACGCINFFIWVLAPLKRIWSLKIFIPPVVDPAHPPINMIIIIITIPKLPQLEKLLLEYPVPVKIDIILNSDNLNELK